MTWFDLLYGDVAVVVLGAVLFANEAGVPMPVTGELILIVGGILVGTGAVDAWLLVPVAITASLGGAFTGYSWTRLVGEKALMAVATRFRQGPRLARVTARMARAGPLRIALYRMIPGFRVYTSLVAGAAGVDRLRFLAGVAAVIVPWVVIFTIVGAVVGTPAKLFLTQLQSFLVQGALLIGVGVGAYVLVRRVPAAGRAALARVPGRLRVALSVAVDVALVGTVVAGVLAIIGGLLAAAVPLLYYADLARWIELVTVVVAIAVFYSFATRRGVRATAGETLFETGYLTPGGTHQDVLRLHRARNAGLDEETEQPAELVSMSVAFSCLADTRRLRVAQLLLHQKASSTEVATMLFLSVSHAGDALRELEEAGLVAGEGDGADRRYAIVSDHVRLGLTELLAHAYVHTGRAEG